MAAFLLFLVFIVAVIIGIPIAVSMVLGAGAPILFLGSGGTLSQLINNCFSGANSTPILAVPLFILAGVLMSEGGISRKLFNIFAYLIGSIPGGMPCAAILTCLFFGAISGSGPATTAAVGAMCLPFLCELGYDKTEMAGIIAVAGGLGVIIPPSIPFVLYSLATGVSTGDLFIAGIVPGLIIAVLLVCYTVISCKRSGENRALINQKTAELKSTGLFNLIKDGFWALLSPVIVLGGIYSGFFTPTEAATIAATYALIISLFVYKSFGIKDIPTLFAKAIESYAPLAFILAFATAFGRVLSLTGAAASLADFFLASFHSAWIFTGVVVLLFLLLGTVMDTGPAIIILAPLLLPVAETLGVDPVHFGVVLVCCLSIGLATPPFGLDLFVAAKLAELEPMSVAKSAKPYIIMFIVAIALVAFL